MEEGYTVIIPRGVRLHHDRVRDCWFLLAPERAIELDSIGLAILNEVDNKSTLKGISRHLAHKYDADEEQILKDVSEFMQALALQRVIELR